MASALHGSTGSPIKKVCSVVGKFDQETFCESFESVGIVLNRANNLSVLLRCL